MIKEDGIYIIKTLRKQKGWTQERLAEIAGVNVRTIQRAESGIQLHDETLMSIAAALDTPLDALYRKQEDTQPKIDSINPISGESTEEKRKKRPFFKRRLFWVNCYKYLCIVIYISMGFGLAKLKTPFWGYLVLFISVTILLKIIKKPLIKSILFLLSKRE